MANLTTLANCKIQLDIPTSDTSQDALLTRLIAVASGMIEQYCGRILAQQTLTEYYDGTGRNELIVDQYPIVVTNLYMDNSRVFGVDSIVSATDYLVKNYTLTMLNGGVWFRGIGNIKLVYQGGYASIPSDLEYGAILLVEFLFRAKQDRRLGRTSISKSGESVSYSQTGLPPEVVQCIEPYKSLRFRISHQSLGF